MADQVEMERLVEVELNRVTDLARRSELNRFLIAPTPLSLGWDYGKEDERFDCWCVGCFPDGKKLLVYSNQGFGPSFPWGVVGAEDGSMGMDDQWHSGLEDAAICAGLIEAPPGYESPGPRE